MPAIASAYRGPLLAIGLGSGFSLVGAVPVAVTFSVGMSTSATIIGMGFVGFGFLLIIPGLVWCVRVRLNRFGFLRRKRRPRDRNRGGEEEEEEEEATPALNKASDSHKLNSTPRERTCQPPLYDNSPPLIITDHCVPSDPQLNPVSTTSVAGLGNAVFAQACGYDNEDDPVNETGDVDSSRRPVDVTASSVNEFATRQPWTHVNVSSILTTV